MIWATVDVIVGPPGEPTTARTLPCLVTIVGDMLLSMRSALAEARTVTESSASSVAEAFAEGALVGAQGNSGIILSQFWQGLSQGIRGNSSIRTTDFTQSLQLASSLSVQALSKPVQGTILTVIKDIAAAGKQSSVEDFVPFIEGLVEEARKSAAEVLRVNPKISLDWLAKMLPWKNKDQVARWIDDLRKAGLK